MAKDKPIQPEVKIQAQKAKESPVIPQKEKKEVLTVKQRIDAVVDKYIEDKEELKKQIFQLVQRILYPEQFCLKCDERMFFTPATSTYNCPNCNYQSTVTILNGTARIVPRPTGKVPEVVEKAIAEADESMKDVPIIPPRPTALGEKIRKLVNDRDAGGPATPTQQDEARVKSDKNVANKINWV